MSAHNDIARLLEQWRNFTKAEAAAIQTADWAEVRKLQSAKAGLKKILDAARENFTRENPAGRVPQHLQAQVARLISMESRNADLIEAQRARARAQQANLDQARLTLRKIQRSYHSPATPGGWQRYS